MKNMILVTGGEGFIGSHISDRLRQLGHAVRTLDSFDPQVHGGEEKPRHDGLIRGDVTDPAVWKPALKDVEVVFHQAAAVGVGQSMYQIRKYVGTNVLGTASLLDHLVNEEHGVKKLVLASSNTVYGEGSYNCRSCGYVYPGLRLERDLRESRWEPRCPSCGEELIARPTREDKPLGPTSIYALTKKNQEELCRQIGDAYGISTVVLRYFCVYGVGQSLSNPYTGVCSIFSTRIRAGKPPVIYEDGKQTRDFVNVNDIVQANLLAMNKSSMNGGCFNVGTGVPTSILEVAGTIARAYHSSLDPDITGRYRKGDIRHCFADITEIEKHGYRPDISFEDGIMEFTQWTRGEESTDRYRDAEIELERRGLVSGGG